MGGVLSPEGCAGRVVIHEDSTYTCTDDGCGASSSTAAALRGHRWFLACRDTLGDGCPVCQQFRLGQALSTT